MANQIAFLIDMNIHSSGMLEPRRLHQCVSLGSSERILSEPEFRIAFDSVDRAYARAGGMAKTWKTTSQFGHDDELFRLTRTVPRSDFKPDRRFKVVVAPEFKVNINEKQKLGRTISNAKLNTYLELTLMNGRWFLIHTFSQSVYASIAVGDGTELGSVIETECTFLLEGMIDNDWELHDRMVEERLL